MAFDVKNLNTFVDATQVIGLVSVDLSSGKVTHGEQTTQEKPLMQSKRFTLLNSRQDVER